VGEQNQKRCVYAIKMSSTAELIRTARTSRGLTQRALAARAGIEQSTIARIENGDADPTWTTVNRLLESAGFHLAEPIPTVPILAEAATDDGEIDWTMVRAVTDRAERSPTDTALMIGAEPSNASATTAVILAAIGAYLAEQHHLRVPRWIRHTRPLDQPWHLPGTPRMVERARRETPPAIARFNIWLRPDILHRNAS
jgi:transcriptional regulator with XRE-family HTH domain